MKYLLSLTLLIALSNIALASQDAKAVDALVAAYQIDFPKIQMATLPDSIICAKGSDQEINISDLRNSASASEESFGPRIKVKTNDAQTGLVIDWSDGDQIGGVFFKMNDLKKLSAGNSVFVSAKAYSGFWWIDGDHYEMSDVECSGSL
jgi:hypothetical protein